MTAPLIDLRRYGRRRRLAPFRGNTLTIDLDDGGPSTVTRGHAHDCPQNPNRAPVRQESAT